MSARRRWTAALAGLAAIGLLAACVSPRTPTPSLPPGGKRLTITSEMVEEYLSNKTRRSWDPAHGVQVEYTSADGRAYLWYPGNKLILAGRWKTLEYDANVPAPDGPRSLKQFKVCFDYGPNTYNPATGHAGGWECTHFVNLLFSGGPSRSGDVFGLAKRKTPPFILDKTEKPSLDELLARVGSGRSRPVREPLVFISSSQEAKARLVGKTASVREMGYYVFLDADGTGLVWVRGDQASTRVKWALRNGAQVNKGKRRPIDVPKTSQFVSLSFPPSDQTPEGHTTDIQVDTLTVDEGVTPPPPKPS